MNTDVFEDIIVFSDHEYDKISQKAKGSNHYSIDERSTEL